MGYNIRPFLFFIEIYNNDKSDRKEYFGERFLSEGDPTAVFGCVRCAKQMDIVGREDTKKFLDMLVFSLPREGEEGEEETMT